MWLNAPQTGSSRDARRPEKRKPELWRDGESGKARRKGRSAFATGAKSDKKEKKKKKNSTPLSVPASFPVLREPGPERREIID